MNRGTGHKSPSVGPGGLSITCRQLNEQSGGLERLPTLARKMQECREIQSTIAVLGLSRAASKFASDAAVRQEVRLELQLVERGLHIPTRD